MNLKELAKKMDVSLATVSRALNPATSALVAEPLRGRIQRYAQRVHYSPDAVARQLVQGKTHTIGVILYSAFGTMFFSEYLYLIQWGICAALDAIPGYSFKLVILPRGKTLLEVDRQIVTGGVDGLLIATLCDYLVDKQGSLVSQLAKQWSKPIVSLNLEPAMAGRRVSTVFFSNREAAYSATTHLIQNGHKRIALIFNDDGAPDVKARVEGFKAALADHQLTFDPSLTFTGNSTPTSGYKATLELFKRKESAEVTAIFCSNDEMALGALKALAVLGKRCPQDVAVMGFDGLMMGEHTVPRLTTVPQPFFEIAKQGTTLLIDLIEGKRRGPIHTQVPTHLTVRDSA